MFHDQIKECASVLRRIYPEASELQVQDKLMLLQRDVHKARTMNANMSTTVSLKQLHCIPSNLRALIVACGLMAIQQFCGFNALMYYSSTLFASIGFDNSIAVGTVVAATNFLFTLVSLWQIDRIGRRRMLVWSMWGMVSANLSA
jgi:SP family myo-inositol transporter-like MFS transporter 13